MSYPDALPPVPAFVLSVYVTSSPAGGLAPPHRRPVLCVVVASFDPVTAKAGDPVAVTDTNDGRPWLTRSVATMPESKFASVPLLASDSITDAVAAVGTAAHATIMAKTVPTPTREPSCFCMITP